MLTCDRLCSATTGPPDIPVQAIVSMISSGPAPNHRDHDRVHDMKVRVLPYGGY